jgi:D-arabinose 1-dehydrogenase-like Zn-dependent alcohol dehydrogenase
MRAAVLRAFGRPLELTEVPDPVPGPEEALVRVRAVGICGTDLKIIAGAFPDTPLPLVPGHEVAGELVADTGHLAAGTRVACYVYDPCGGCRWCQGGQETLCPASRRLGFDRWGGLADLIAVPRRNLLPFPAGVPFELAAVAMDAVTAPWRALTERARIGSGETLAVVGAGGLGLSGIQIARAAGARVAAVDPLAGNRELALQAGAELAVEPARATQVREWAGEGCDVAFEASGTREGFEVAAAVLRMGGRLVCCGYRPGQEYGLDSARLVLGEITVLGSRNGSRNDARAALAAVAEGRVRPQVTERLPLEAAERALERLREGGVRGRVVVCP